MVAMSGDDATGTTTPAQGDLGECAPGTRMQDLLRTGRTLRQAGMWRQIHEREWITLRVSFRKTTVQIRKNSIDASAFSFFV
jgi:hypothetical protein